MSLERFHPHAQQHVFPASDQLPPLSGTLRLYVDGTAGSDAASGQGGWGNAWRTWARTYRAACAILFVEPSNLTLILYVRGAFAESICGTFECYGSTRVHVVHHVDDWDTIRTGAVSAVGGEAPAPKHGLERITFAAGIALDGTEFGMLLVLDDPVSGSRATCTVLRVDVANRYVWTTQLIGEFPAWVAASPANATIRRPSFYTTADIGLTFVENTVADTPLANTVVGLRAGGSVNIAGGQLMVAGLYCRATSGTWKTFRYWCSGFTPYVCYYRQGGIILSDALATEFGLITGPTPTTYNVVGNACGGFYPELGSRIYFAGYCDVTVDNSFGASISVARSSVQAVYTGGAYSTLTNNIYRGHSTYGCIYCNTGLVKASKFSCLDLPAAGVPALIATEGCASKIDVTDANIEGNNTGTGADRKMAWSRAGQIIFRSGIPVELKAKHRQVVAEENGNIECRGAVVFGSNEGGGPDVYVGPAGASVGFQDNFTKSAVNSETAIQNGVDGKIVAIGTKFQSAGALFTAAHIGRSIKVSGSATPANNAVHLITAYTSPTEVIIGASVGLVNDGPGRTWGLVGTPQPIIECARGGRVSQASGKTFNVRKPEVDPDTGLQEWNNYGYGPNGFIYEHENSEATLGTLVEAAGIATATGIAARLRNRSTLLHTGGAVPLGVAPLVLGGNPPSAWPATALSEPTEGCTIIPNV